MATRPPGTNDGPGSGREKARPGSFAGGRAFAGDAEASLARARELVLAHGSNANAYQILNPGIAHWFSRAGDALAGHVRHRGFVIVAGAPVCDDARLDDVLAEFEAEVHGAGLRLCYFGAEDALASRLAKSPRHALLCLGAQPAWDPSRWEAGVRGHSSLRAQLHRAANKGVVVREASVEEATANAAMQRCLDEWLATRGAPPMHFLVEPQTLGRLYDRRVFVAERDGSMVGFLVASPVPRRSGWLVEQIIRGTGAVNGTSELLVDAAMRALAEGGSAYVTLGLSPLSKRGDGSLAVTPAWLRLLLGWLRAHGRRFYNFEGLDAFKAKLGPHRWEAVYAIADGERITPAVLHAVAGAFTSGSPAVATARALAWAVAHEARGVAGRGRRGARPAPVDRLGRSE